jgi:tetratricopeptide (TPR) repeat protein
MPVDPHKQPDPAEGVTTDTPAQPIDSSIADRNALPPKSKGVLAQLEEVYAAAGRLRNATNSTAKRPDLLSRLEDMYAETGRWESVLDLYLEYARSRPTIAEKTDLYLRAARLCEERLSSPNRAFDAYLLAFLLDINDEDTANALAASADQTDRWNEVNEACDKYFEKDSTSESALNLMLRTAVWADARGQTDRSGRMLKRAIESRPGDMLTLRKVGIAYLDMGRWQDAATWLGRALQLAGPSRLRAEIAYDLGRLAEQYSKDGQYARIYFTRAIQADPSFSEAKDALMRIGR